MIKPIRGKVARVLNEREIALNVGTENGVTVDMHFDIIDPSGLHIKDPDTGRELGSIKRTKVRVRVTHVQDRLSIATTYRSKRAAAAMNNSHRTLSDSWSSLETHHDLALMLNLLCLLIL